MTKSQRKIFGKQDAEDDNGLVHYGPTCYNTLLHPEQIQPAHIVISSLALSINDGVTEFRTEERKLQHGTKNHETTQGQRDRMVHLRAEGLTYVEIAERMGVHKHTVARICKGESK